MHGVLVWDFRSTSGSTRPAPPALCLQGRAATSMIVAHDHLRVCMARRGGAIADITKADNFGFTPMHVACWCKVMPVICPTLTEI